MKKIISFLLMICVLLFACSCDFSDTPKFTYSNINLNVEYNSYLGYSAEVTGQLKNNTNKSYSYVSIEFTIYDENGYNIGTCFDNLSNFGANETWSFSASYIGFLDSKPVSCKYKDVTFF